MLIKKANPLPWYHGANMNRYIIITIITHDTFVMTTSRGKQSSNSSSIVQVILPFPSHPYPPFDCDTTVAHKREAAA